MPKKTSKNKTSRTFVFSLILFLPISSIQLDVLSYSVLFAPFEEASKATYYLIASGSA
ncbi:hypothetical protein [Bacteroides reticulotermitis]|uniref:Uncharacterized protein n=2 Tax=Bacteroides reticulotermitis TaxID=1133319 RepID=W4UZA1_9BACE|nr:hypothetical protein [Bacteroides reticulotermitis]MBB4046268.1 hypothetical protein [Bacteroides reticulotermitis]GAE86281.1 hypothetical protein JCM10512_4781 [Bacteroides reticulotermitis JCM 10512]